MVTLTIRQFASIKRVAQNVNPLVTKKNKITEKIAKLKEEHESLCKEIECHEMGVITITNGYTSEDLVVKVVEETGKEDKNGNPIKTTKYEPNSELVTFDKESNMYIIREKESEVEVDELSDSSLDEVDDTEQVDEVETEDAFEGFNL